MNYKAILAAAVSCVALATTASAVDFQIQRIDAATLKFDGDIDKESADALFKALDDRVRTLRVTSPGGDMWQGILIGKYIHDHRITVEVDNLCASSCANYLFLAAASKRVLPGAVLGFHGDLIGEMSGEKQAALRKLGEPTEAATKDPADIIERNQRLELAFRDRVGLGQGFFVHANDRVHEFWKTLGRKRAEPTGEIVVTTADEVKRFPIGELETAMHLVEELSTKNIKFEWKMTASVDSGYGDIIYFPSRETLERFGICGIMDYPYPASNTELKETDLLKKRPELHVLGDFPSA
jgi:hypothetical protein